VRVALAALALVVAGFVLARTTLGSNAEPTAASNSSSSITIPHITTLPTITIHPPTTAVVRTDLAISKSDSPDPVLVGQALTYRLDITGSGNTPGLGNATVTDALPAGVSFQSASTTQGSCTAAGGTVTCALGSVAAGASPRVTIVVVPMQDGTISNTASLKTSEDDRNPRNNVSTEQTTIKPVADVRIAKSGSPDPVHVGDTLVYALTVTNDGPSGAGGVTVSDNLPASVKLMSASASQGSCNPGASVGCSLGSLAKGASATVDIKVMPGQAGTIANTASVKADPSDPNSGNNTASAATTVKPLADLILTKADAPDPVVAGATLTYTLEARNNGPSDATGVTVTDKLPPSIVLASSKPSCTQTAGTLKCPLGSLAKGATASVEIAVIPTQAGGITNTASVSGAEDDPDDANNHAAAKTRVRSAADLSLTKTDAPDPVAVGSQLVYVLAVANKGPSPATGVKVTDTLPASVEGKSAQASQGACALTAPLVKCTLGKMTKGGAAAITIKVTPDKPGHITNTASVSGDALDPQPGNNKATAETQVKRKVIHRHGTDLSLRKIASLARLAVHGKLIYTLIVTNGGPDKATEVAVIDKLPGALGLLSAVASKGGCNGQTKITCKLGSLDVGALAKVTLVVRVKAARRIANTAFVTGHEPDPTPENNTALSAPVTVTATATGRHRYSGIVPKLIVRPPLGPPGFVTRAFGRDFPANASVVLTWNSGLGRLRVVADRKGRFEVPVLIFYHDLLGPRDLIATPAPGAPGFRPPRARFLVVQGTLQPPRFQPRG
jgi:uncharacterized repeat protein (TIGR01451 family)